MDSILNSPNPQARELMLDAAFAAGPAIVPNLQKALADDRTAEFAAQALAFIGGPDAIKIVVSLLNDKRNLNLRRFSYGAFGEYRSPEATKALLDAVTRADAEPDRTVIQAAIMAFSVRADPAIVPQLREAESKIKDFVLRDDLENVIAVVEKRSHLLAAASANGRPAGSQVQSPSGSTAGPGAPTELAAASLQEAIHLYFLPAFADSNRAGRSPTTSKSVTGSPASRRTSASGKASPAASADHPQEDGAVKVDIVRVILSPDKTRALAHVAFREPDGTAYYDMVLNKRFGEWVMASVWLGEEVPYQAPATQPAAKQDAEAKQADR